ncbi:Hypothetical predicted protein [Olea europaea subsp. europaea]|uniref:Uncharacterized protein n=1 Tax=Olea europaea subsp. europaea TaxID=158383 RepID=A0A8S0P8Q6_OLEEU|nr:Hypothetical predicted protein [Olea europaea subsp. europaea]
MSNLPENDGLRRIEVALVLVEVGEAIMENTPGGAAIAHHFLDYNTITATANITTKTTTPNRQQHYHHHQVTPIVVLFSTNHTASHPQSQNTTHIVVHINNPKAPNQSTISQILAVSTPCNTLAYVESSGSCAGIITSARNYGWCLVLCDGGISFSLQGTTAAVFASVSR